MPTPNLNPATSSESFQNSSAYFEVVCSIEITQHVDSSYTEGDPVMWNNNIDLFYDETTDLSAGLSVGKKLVRYSTSGFGPSSAQSRKRRVSVSDETADNGESTTAKSAAAPPNSERGKTLNSATTNALMTNILKDFNKRLSKH